jgi:hypothetical protein
MNHTVTTLLANIRVIGGNPQFLFPVFKQNACMLNQCQQLFKIRIFPLSLIAVNRGGFYNRRYPGWHPLAETL